MRDTTRCRWQRWRVTLVERPAPCPAVDRFTRRSSTATGSSDAVDSGGAEIRHELVARIRAEIEAGTYDTEEKWLAAEEVLMRQATRGW